MNSQAPQASGSDTTASATVVPDCRCCRHFGISWQPATPYLCRLMGFRSRAWPALEVLRADGQPCRGFVPKALVARGKS
jgi:hypothetical protein